MGKQIVDFGLHISATKLAPMPKADIFRFGGFFALSALTPPSGISRFNENGYRVGEHRHIRCTVFGSPSCFSPIRNCYKTLLYTSSCGSLSARIRSSCLMPACTAVANFCISRVRLRGWVRTRLMLLRL